MTNILHWSGIALGLLVLILGIRAFLRGLSLKPSDPATRPPERWWGWGR
ncbi:MAG TPA: hypothetical protein VIY51_06625 [Xanthobacteraceae bacterium]